ncbi:MAG: hypothetical protein HY885_02705 [Deltaproteobacteria bacterium]|nr:hypothetical protein [Deltaproteobacteria bacterium]
MKKNIVYLFFPLLFFLTTLSSAPAQPRILSAAEMTRVLSEKTFSLTYTGENKGNSLIYFSRDGKYTILFPSGNVRSTEKWQADSNGDLCLRKVKRSKKDDQYITRCGKLSLVGENTLFHHDDTGKHILSLQYIGNGNLLGKPPY